MPNLSEFFRETVNSQETKYPTLNEYKPLVKETIERVVSEYPEIKHLSNEILSEIKRVNVIKTTEECLIDKKNHSSYRTVKNINEILKILFMEFSKDNGLVFRSGDKKRLIKKKALRLKEKINDLKQSLLTRISNHFEHYFRLLKRLSFSLCDCFKRTVVLIPEIQGFLKQKSTTMWRLPTFKKTTVDIDRIEAKFYEHLDSKNISITYDRILKSSNDGSVKKEKINEDDYEDFIKYMMGNSSRLSEYFDYISTINERKLEKTITDTIEAVEARTGALFKESLNIPYCLWRKSDEYVFSPFIELLNLFLKIFYTVVLRYEQAFK